MTPGCVCVCACLRARSWLWEGWCVCASRASYFFLNFYLFMCFWLCSVFLALQAFSNRGGLERGGNATLAWGAGASLCGASLVAESRLKEPPTQLCWRGLVALLEAESSQASDGIRVPAWAGGFLTAETPGMSQQGLLEALQWPHTLTVWTSINEHYRTKETCEALILERIPPCVQGILDSEVLVSSDASMQRVPCEKNSLMMVTTPVQPPCYLSCIISKT